MKRKVNVMERAAWMYRNLVYVKTWRRQWGRLPITHLRPVHIRAHDDTQRIESFPIPKGWKRGNQVRTADSESFQLIDAHELVVPRPVKKSTSFDSNCSHKLQRNLDWLALCIGHPRGPGREAIVLDGIGLKTSMLSGWGNAFEKIHVPNFDTEFEKKLAVTKPNNVTIYPGSMYEFLLTQDHTTEGYDVAADYCASFGGNQDFVLPQGDLTYLLSHGLFARKNGVLWLTFSTRHKGGSAEGTLREVKKFMKTLSQETDYTLELCSCGSYFNTDAKGLMVYLFYRSV